jgi:hypothetical protein
MGRCFFVQLKPLRLGKGLLPIPENSVCFNFFQEVDDLVRVVSRESGVRRRSFMTRFPNACEEQNTRDWNGWNRFDQRKLDYGCFLLIAEIVSSTKESKVQHKIVSGLYK